MKNKYILVAVLVLLTGCQTGALSKSPPLIVSPPQQESKSISISGGGLVGGEFGTDLTARDKRLGLSAEYKALEFGKAGELIAWTGEGNVVTGKVNAAQPYRVGSQDCRQYRHEIIVNGASKVKRGTACRNSDGSWNLLE